MTESDIFKYFIGAGLTPEGAAAVMGNLMAESGLKSTNLQNSFEKKLGMNDEQYTAAVDSGMYANFVRDGAGYGLAQWTFWSRKQKLLEYARSYGLSIGDVGMQLSFLLSEISAYGKLWSDLRTTNDIDALSDEVLTSYERPADIKGEIEKRRQYAREIFARCTGGNSGTTATQGIDLTGNPGTTITGGGGVTANQDKTNYSAEKASGTPTKTYDNADSPLVTVTCWTTKHSGQRNQPISKITIHHMAGVGSAERCMKDHKNGIRNVSANYYIGKDAEIGQAVPESCRAWTSADRWNDNRAITIEASNSVAADPWPISGEVYKSLIALCVDICKRNGIKEVHYTGDKDGSLTIHSFYRNTLCPGPTIKGMLESHQIENDINAMLSGTSAAATPTMNGFKVRVTISDLNIRAGAGTNYGIVGICPPGVYTIVETAQGKGSSKGWGRLKSGMGWISLGFAELV